MQAQVIVEQSKIVSGDGGQELIVTWQAPVTGGNIFVAHGGKIVAISLTSYQLHRRH